MIEVDMLTGSGPYARLDTAGQNSGIDHNNPPMIGNNRRASIIRRCR
jgi:hypothetical protein